MIGKLLPVVLILIGLGAGVGAGLALRPAPEPAAAEIDCVVPEGGAPVVAAALDDHAAEGEAAATDFVKMNNQFVVPVVDHESIAALVVMSISLEVPVGGSEAVYQREPKLRDAFLQVLFNHANSGGFDGAFTAGPKMQTLRTALGEVARAELGANVLDVLITDIARQDL